MCKRSSVLFIVESMVTKFFLMISGSQTLIPDTEEDKDWLLHQQQRYSWTYCGWTDEESNLHKLFNYTNHFKTTTRLSDYL